MPTNPLSLFHEWLDMAKASEINDPDAMALATSTPDGVPSVRMVLLKSADDRGFKFHSNAQSQKGIEIENNKHVSLCFHWKSLRKQVRVDGVIHIIPDDEADAYFESRPYARQIGAWASQQSSPLDSRKTLVEKIKTLGTQYPQGTIIPRPPYWVGYRVVPEKIEFWWDNPDRLHDRIIYIQNDDKQWKTQRLYP